MTGGDIDGRRRAVIEGVEPEIDAGRFPIKRVVGEAVVVEADIFADGHDLPACALQYRHETEGGWSETAMSFLGNDRWRGSFTVTLIGRYRYRPVAWIDRFATWLRDLARREEAADLETALKVGSGLVAEAAARASPDDRLLLEGWSARLAEGVAVEERRRLALDPELAALMSRYPDRRVATLYERELAVVVDRERALFSAWYELFPRSWNGGEGGHGTFRSCEARLPYVAAMGFDVIYLPPIHPIGRTRRKGRNNILVAAPEEPGSPWAIGNPDGGHTAVHPRLGTIEEFRRFVERSKALGMEVALDIAFQCSPDHPYVTDHPEWFRHRPDGSVQYAENPPKKYEDIYPFDFESDEWRRLWEELKGVVLFWIGEGVRIFRVDNPHTKPFPFWEWLIGEVKASHPEVLFLAEAFSRPKVMLRLARLGFSQSYTYFTWRNSKPELERYLSELTRGEIVEYFRPNLWPNTPDILPEYLQYGGRPAFMARLTLAATLSASYGLYGPAFELQESEPQAPGSEEYLNSEKYELRRWDLDREGNLSDFIARINRIRRENRALHANRRLRFHPIDNDAIIAYSKSTDDLSNIIVVVVSLDPHRIQSGRLRLPLAGLGIDPAAAFQVHDLVTGERHLWHGEANALRIDPHRTPAHIFRLRRRVRTEHDFEYFL